MRKWFRAFLFFSRPEKRGIILLLALIGTFILARQVYFYRQSRKVPTEEELKAQEEAVKAYQAFATSVKKQEEEKRKTYPTRFPNKKLSDVTPVLAPFEPNTADSITFRRLGLPGWMARNILRYREKGGTFRQPEDFRKIYGLTDEQYNTIRPYIHITTQKSETPHPQLFLTDNRPDSLLYEKPFKYAPGTIIDLNRADTTELKKIPGIGSGIARLICGYRQQLGGFYTIRQLEEIKLDYRQLEAWFHIDTAAIRRININRIGVDFLRRHPYINFYQAKALVEYRKKHGPLKSLKPFVLYEEFTREDLERIGHYLSFGNR